MTYGNEWSGFLLLISIINRQEAFELYVAIRVGVCTHFVVMICSGGIGVSCYAYEIFAAKAAVKLSLEKGVSFKNNRLLKATQIQ